MSKIERQQQEGFRVDYRYCVVHVIGRYGSTERIQLLFEKDSYIRPEHPKYKLFSRFTEQEKEAGFLDFEDYGPDKEVWNVLLQNKSLEIRGHRLQKG